MIKICGDSIFKPLDLILKSCLENGKFPIERKKANVVPVHEKKTNSYRKLSSDFIAACLW